MGTSSSYPGPTGKTSLLPPWAPDLVDPDASDDSQVSMDELEQPEVSWSSPKRQVSSLLNQIASQGYGSTYRSLTRSYVGALGGSRTAARTAIAGRQTARTLASFLGLVATRGIEGALSEAGLGTLAGQDAFTVASAIMDLIAPSGATLEDAAARNALVDTINEVFNQALDTGIDMAALEALDASRVGNILQTYVSNYVSSRIEIDLGNQIATKSRNDTEANQLMREVRGFIREVVRFDFERMNILSIDWNGREGQRVIDRIFATAFSLVEG